MNDDEGGEIMEDFLRSLSNESSLIKWLSSAVFTSVMQSIPRISYQHMNLLFLLCNYCSVHFYLYFIISKIWNKADCSFLQLS